VHFLIRLSARTEKQAVIEQLDSRQISVDNARNLRVAW
jgi:type IV secretory pathway component VirB8